MLRRLSLLGALSVLGGCTQGVIGGAGGGSGGNGGAGGSGGSGGAGGAPAFAVSDKANVRYKRVARLTADYAQALSIPIDQLCKELGQYPCSLVHQVALGGTDPYGVGLYEPLPFTGMATPIVTERLALNACQQRATADVAAGSSAVLWKGVQPDGAGKLDVNAPAVTAALDLLYRRALLRHPTEAELGHLKALYADIEASGKPSPGASWMVLSCFAVLTTTEALFY